MSMYTVLSRNFNFLRHTSGRHKDLALRLMGTVSSNFLSKLATADAVAGPSILREVEAKLSLPPGWFDRDNLAFTKLDAVDHELVTALLACSPAARASMLRLINDLKN